VAGLLGGGLAVTRPLATALAVALAALAPAAARADVVEQGAIVKVEAREIYVNLGARDGIEEGARLRIKRPIELRHPATRERVRDWLPIGAAEVTSAGDQLSMAILDEDLHAAVEPGDVVEIYVEREEAAAPPPPPKPKPTPAPRPKAPPPPVDDRPLPQVDAETEVVLSVWADQTGATLDARIAAWEGFLAAHAGSPYADAVREDLAALRELRDTLAPPTTPTGTIAGVAHEPLTRARAGEEVALVFVLDDPGAIEAAWLHYRRVGEPTYQRTLLARTGRIYLRGTIPAAAVAAPGLEYFVEAAGASGEPGIAVAATTVDVERIGVAEYFAPKRRRTRMSLTATYMDFATFDDRPGDRTDRVFQFEADVAYRLAGRVDGLAAGLGILDGEGGFIDADQTLPDPSPSTGFQYGYAEGELALMPRLGVAARLIAGVDQTELRFGVEGRVRIGDVEGTSLSITGSQIASVGHLSQVRLEVDPFGQVPVGLSVGVTDRPAQGDLAVRLGVDVGLRTLPWCEPVLRLSYQGRTVEHSGLGGGLGLNFHW
jgi:hypothetical protein